LRPKPEERLLQFEVSPPSGYTFGTTHVGRYAISPDGSKLAFVATSSDGKRSLWVRPLDAAEANQLPGTEGAIGPIWDPASRWIAFGANGKLQKIEVTGGQPHVLCDTPVGLIVGTWSRDGIILFSDDSRTLRRVYAGGGAASQALPLDESRKETAQVAPQFLPDGRRFLYSTFAQQSGIGLGSLDGKSQFPMIPDGPGYYVPSLEGKAYLLFLRRNQLLAQPALHRLELQGWIKAEWRPTDTGRMAKFYSLSRSGSRQYQKELETWTRLSTAINLVVQEG
jgi:hypothetical protein